MYGNQRMLATEKTQGTRHWVMDLFFIALFFGLFYAAWIGSYALFTPDEGRYSEVAREMVSTGDYITPRLNGVAFLDKPALYYWLQASAINLFGLKEWALRFWPSALGILGCLTTYATGRILFNRRTGIIAATILATSPLYYGAAHYANLDLEVAVLISNSLMFFLLGIHYTKTPWRTPLLFTAYVFAALAFLTKGLIALAFPAMIFGAWILILNRWQTLTKIRMFSGLAIFLALTAPWYYLVQQANPEFLHFFFVTQQVTRFLTKATFNSQAVAWFYVPIVLITFLPWSVFLIQALLHNLKLVWQNRHAHQNELFILLWFTLIFIFFSIPKSKTVGYILPIFPALALLTGRYLDALWDKATSGGIISAKVFFIIVSAIMVVTCVSLPHIQAIQLEPGTSPYLYFTALLFLLTGSRSIIYFKKPRLTQFFSTLTITACIALLTLIASTHIINSKTIKPLALQLKTQLTPNDEVVTYYKYYQDLPIYLERRITIVADWKANDIQYNDNWLREMWYGMPFQDTADWLIQEDAFWQRWNSDKHLYTFMNASYYKDFAQKAQNHAYKIGEYNDVILVSNQA
jgi:4-amino-4-deoxy-L-arabinose transferase-like glycosyltransferase